VISPYALHRHRALWKNPEEFDPERFSPARIGEIARHAYLPFGTGAHQCIGKEFAMAEAQLIIAMVVQRYHLELAADHPVVLRPGITLGLRDGLYVILNRHATAPRGIRKCELHN
jgi:cytochrome P450